MGGGGATAPQGGHKKSDTTEVTKHSTHSIAEFSRRDRTLGSKIMQTGSWRRKVPKTQAWSPLPTALTQTSSVSFARPRSSCKPDSTPLPPLLPLLLPPLGSAPGLFSTLEIADPSL